MILDHLHTQRERERERESEAYVKTVTLKQQTKANKELGFLELEVKKMSSIPMVL
jgi:hypothetical protein